jgi:hypothetical protein
MRARCTANVEAFRDDLDATTGNIEALRDDLDATKAIAESTKASVEDIKDDNQVTNKRLAAMDRHMSAVAESNVQQRRAMDEIGLSVGKNIFITRGEQDMRHAPLAGLCMCLCISALLLQPRGSFPQTAQSRP